VLPTSEVEPKTLLKRLTLIVSGYNIYQGFFSCFPAGQERRRCNRVVILIKTEQAFDDLSPDPRFQGLLLTSENKTLIHHTIALLYFLQTGLGIFTFGGWKQTAKIRFS
jgi:hypothetical protein